MLTEKEFNGTEYHAFCQQQYDEARRFLKSCGKPIDEIDRFLIQKHKVDVQVFGSALDRTKVIRTLQKRKELGEEAKYLRQRLELITTYFGETNYGYTED